MGKLLTASKSNSVTAHGINNIITGLKDKGYELVPISQLIHRGDFTIDHTGRQHKK